MVLNSLPLGSEPLGGTNEFMPVQLAQASPPSPDVTLFIDQGASRPATFRAPRQWAIENNVDFTKTLSMDDVLKITNKGDTQDPIGLKLYDSVRKHIENDVTQTILAEAGLTADKQGNLIPLRKNEHKAPSIKVSPSQGGYPAVRNAITDFISSSSTPKQSPMGDAYTKAVQAYMEPEAPTGSFSELIGTDPGAAFYYALLRGGLGAMQAGGTPGATGLSSLGTGLGAGIDQTIALQTKYDAAKRKAKADKLAALQAAATLTLAQQKQAFAEKTAKLDLGVKLIGIGHKDQTIKLSGDTLTQRKKEFTAKHKNALDRIGIMRGKLTLAQNTAKRDKKEAYVLFNKEDPTQPPDIQYIDPLTDSGEELRNQGYLPLATANEVFNRETKGIELALNRTRTEINVNEMLWKETQARKAEQLPYYREIEENVIESRYFNPRLVEDQNAITTGGWLDEKGFRLQDLVKPDEQWEILGRRNPDGSVDARTVNVKDENSFVNAVSDGYKQKLGVLNASDKVEMVFDTVDNVVKSFVKGTKPHTDYLAETEAHPTRYQLMGKITPEKVVQAGFATADKLQGRYDSMWMIYGRLEEMAKAVKDNPSLIGSSGFLGRAFQSMTGSVKSIARSVMPSIERDMANNIDEAGVSTAREDAAITRQTYKTITNLELIEQELRNNKDYTPELVKIRQLENEIAYALARIEKPTEKINKSDVDTFRETYSLQAIYKSTDDAKVAMVSMGKRLVTAMDLLKRRMGDRFQDPGLADIPILDLELNTFDGKKL